MDPGRFVTLCFIYSGLLLLGQHALVYGFALAPASIAQLLVALCIGGVGLLRLRAADLEETPATFGAFAYGMAALAGLLTLLLFVQLVVA